MLYKLDGGIDHILVDEAQDTAPDQWDIVRALTGEFFAGAGAGATGADRTLFVVGDEQAVDLRFQGADPAKLAEMRDRFAAAHPARQARLRRGAAHRLVPVDAGSARRRRLGVRAGQRRERRRPAGRGDPPAQPPRGSRPGRALATGHRREDRAPTDAAVEAPAGKLTPPHERLARLIAVHAKGLIGKERRARKGELLHPGHFMVLVRRRNEFVNALVRELKREQIEVAGVDRLNLGEELAIQDLLAMARFVLLPQDDLNLACLLKSPLVGLDEDKLFILAWNRKTHLWQALRERAHEPNFAPAHERLSRWLARADFTTPFEFFAQALGPEHGRKLLLERLGHEAADPIDELLSRALQYQRTEAASLQGFLRWFEAGGGEIKRDLDANRRQEVRILTVHASKGLQAPIVYLPDTTRVPNDLERLLAGEMTCGCGCRAPAMPTRPPVRGAAKSAAARWKSRTGCSTSP